MVYSLSKLGIVDLNAMQQDMLEHVRKEASIVLLSATGSGKSSTINAMFDLDVAKVGKGVEPETDKITSYNLSNLTIDGTKITTEKR